MADKEIVYCCGKFNASKINKMSGKQEPLNPDDLQKSPFNYRHKQLERNPYGKISDNRYFKCELLTFKLTQEIYDRNIEGLDNGLKELVENLSSLGFLERILTEEESKESMSSKHSDAMSSDGEQPKA